MFHFYFYFGKILTLVVTHLNLLLSLPNLKLLLFVSQIKKKNVILAFEALFNKNYKVLFKQI